MAGEKTSGSQKVPDTVLDVLIRGGTVYDGTGSPACAGDVGINGDTIVFVGEAGSARGAVEINASRRALVALQNSRYLEADELLGAAVRELGVSLKASDVNTLKEWLNRYLGSEVGRVAPASSAVEVRVSLSLGGNEGQLTLFGFADRCETDRLIDFKTDVAAGKLVERWGDQLRLYTLAARGEGLLKPEATLWIYHAPTAAMLPVPFTAHDETRLRSQLMTLAATLARADAAFPQVKNDWCSWCAARTIVCTV